MLNCFAESGRKLPHAKSNCRNNKRRQNQETGSNKRSAPYSDDKEVTFYRCNERGHYSSNCTNPPAAGGRGGRNQRGRGRGRGERGGAYFLWVPDEGESGNSQHTEAVAAPISIAPAPPPPGYVQPPKSSYFLGFNRVILFGSRITLSHDAQSFTVVLPPIAPSNSYSTALSGSGTTTRNSRALLRWSNPSLLSVPRSLRTTPIIGRWQPSFLTLVPSTNS
jgi:hypothetical protein